MQNGVNIDESIDRYELCDFRKWLLSSNNIFSGMDILKDDVIAILSEKINSKLARNGQSSTVQPGPDKQISMR